MSKKYGSTTEAQLSTAKHSIDKPTYTKPLSSHCARVANAFVSRAKMEMEILCMIVIFVQP